MYTVTSANPTTIKNGMSHHAVWYKFTDVLEEHITSIFRMEKQAKKAVRRVSNRLLGAQLTLQP
jgi:hypothetical protein